MDQRDGEFALHAMGNNQSTNEGSSAENGVGKIDENKPAKSGTTKGENSQEADDPMMDLHLEVSNDGMEEEMQSHFNGKVDEAENGLEKSGKDQRNGVQSEVEGMEVDESEDPVQKETTPSTTTLNGAFTDEELDPDFAEELEEIKKEEALKEKESDILSDFEDELLLEDNLEELTTTKTANKDEKNKETSSKTEKKGKDQKIENVEDELEPTFSLLITDSPAQSLGSSIKDCDEIENEELDKTEELPLESAKNLDEALENSKEIEKTSENSENLDKIDKTKDIESEKSENIGSEIIEKEESLEKTNVTAERLKTDDQTSQVQESNSQDKASNTVKGTEVIISSEKGKELENEETSETPSKNEETKETEALDKDTEKAQNVEISENSNKIIENHVHSKSTTETENQDEIPEIVENEETKSNSHSQPETESSIETKTNNLESNSNNSQEKKDSSNEIEKELENSQKESSENGTSNLESVSSSEDNSKGIEGTKPSEDNSKTPENSNGIEEEKSQESSQKPESIEIDEDSEDDLLKESLQLVSEKPLESKNNEKTIEEPLLNGQDSNSFPENDPLDKTSAEKPVENESSNSSKENGEKEVEPMEIDAQIEEQGLPEVEEPSTKDKVAEKESETVSDKVLEKEKEVSSNLEKENEASSSKELPEKPVEEDLTNGTQSEGDSEPEPPMKKRKVGSCINTECPNKESYVFKAPVFVQSFFNLNKTTESVVCEGCFDMCVEKYEKMLELLQTQKITYDHITPQVDLEIIDSSSDEEENNGAKKKKKKRKTFDTETQELLKNELDSTILSVVERVNFKETSSKFERSYMKKHFTLDRELNSMMTDLRRIIKVNDDYYYKSRLDSKTITEEEWNGMKLNSMEKKLNVGVMCYGQSQLGCFSICQIIGMDIVNNEPIYKTQFPNSSRLKSGLNLKSSQIAIACEPVIMLDVGTRIVSKKKLSGGEFYLGIIAEKYANQYLIFFEDGMVAYSSSSYVRQCVQPYRSLDAACEALKLHSKEFIRTYFTSTRTPIYRFTKNDSVEIEVNGEWVKAVVTGTDNSLVTVKPVNFPRFETYYSGSTRIRPLGRPSIVHFNTSAPCFLKATDGDSGPRQVAKKSSHMRPRQAINRPGNNTQVAKQPVKNMNSSTIFIDEDESKKGQIVYFVSKKKYKNNFVPHECGPECSTKVPDGLSKYNPMAQPIIAGWRRCFFVGKANKTVYYRGPCGRTLRNMYEVHRYLRMTESPFNVDAFEFEPQVHCLAQYVVEKSQAHVDIADLSEGKEPMPISCVNYYDDTMPPDCIYSTERTPTEGVYLNLDQDFLACCDCEDDCLDKNRCQCWQLTIQGAKVRNPNLYPDEVGYVYKRLPSPVETGIYECNSRCKCKANCLNRVVQNKIQLKLQVYKTANRGWGIRCLNDIPKGGFVCVYAGHLLTEQKANDGGEGGGDEYFAELDYIEVAERLKEGYESDVPEGSSESDSEREFEERLNELDNENDSDEDFVTSVSKQIDKNIKARLRPKSKTQQLKSRDPVKKPKPIPVRKLFGENEEIYVMDAKITGNIGRYFNHSCTPNLFVQNVFVDTHDLRFPWVSFFALHNIRAGSELSWNYNYDVGSVAGKILICQCGSDNCRGRIL